MEDVLFSNVILKKDGHVATLIVNRPKALNALNWDTTVDITAAIENARDDEDIYVIIIAGAGDKAFVAGGDIAYMQKLTALEGRKFGQLGHKMCRTIENIEKPVIAAINGFCLGGGCELAMACDFRICTDKSKFGQPEVGLGLTAGFGGTQRLPRLVGKGMALQILYTGDNFDAQEALRIGLVNKVVSPDKLMDEVTAIANTIASKGPRAVNLTKAAVNAGMETDIDRALAFEADIFGICFSTADQKEGMTAFLEKRKPNFSGK
ncbi:MAG TPA: enoyl-CoA hydratase-related protein [Syntrophomonas sp.]|nr:enoyl-CoA hydratase-related protein [Syntrophomonas sp.]